MYYRVWKLMNRCRWNERWRINGLGYYIAWGHRRVLGLSMMLMTMMMTHIAISETKILRATTYLENSPSPRQGKNWWRDEHFRRQGHKPIGRRYWECYELIDDILNNTLLIRGLISCRLCIADDSGDPFLSVSNREYDDGGW